MAFRVNTPITIILGIVLICFIGSAKPVQSAITCNQVVNSLTPCVNSVLYGVPVTVQCCQGMHDLYSAAKTTPDRQQICTCVKNVAGGAASDPNLLRNAAGLPARCGMNIPYKISPTTDCKSIK